MHLIRAGTLILLLLAVGASPAAAVTCEAADPATYCWHTLTVDRGSVGTVDSAPAGITCGALTCTGDSLATRTCGTGGCTDWHYDPITLIASDADEGYAPSWTGCDLDPLIPPTQCKVLMSADRTVKLVWADVQAPHGLVLTAPVKAGPATTIKAAAADNSRATPRYDWIVSGKPLASHAATITLAGFAAGVRSVSVIATDAAGNHSAPAAKSVTLDTSASLSAPALPAYTNAPTVPLTFATQADVASDAAHRMCRVGTAAFGRCTTPTSFSPVGAGSADGRHVYTVKVIDDVGNQAQLQRTFTLDRTKPVVRFASGSAAPAFSVVDANLAGVRCAIDGRTPGACASSSTVSVAGLAAGQHTVQVIARDRAGNQGAATQTFSVPAARKLNARVAYSFTRAARKTRFRRLVLKRVPAGAKVVVTCKGAGCPKRRYTLTKTWSAKPLLGRRLGAVKITFRVTKPGWRSQAIVLRTYKGKNPVVFAGS